MATGNTRRLAECSMPTPTAAVVAGMITAGATPSGANYMRLTEVGIPARLAREMVNQITGTKNVRRLSELGVVPVLARELVAQMNS